MSAERRGHKGTLSSARLLQIHPLAHPCAPARRGGSFLARSRRTSAAPERPLIGGLRTSPQRSSSCHCSCSDNKLRYDKDTASNQSGAAAAGDLVADLWDGWRIDRRISCRNARDDTEQGLIFEMIER